MYPLKKNNFLKNNLNVNNQIKQSNKKTEPIINSNSLINTTKVNTNIKSKQQVNNLNTQFYWDKLNQSYPYDSNKKYCIFFNGCCCPPHKGHINSIRQAIKMFPGCKIIMNQLGSSKRHGVPSKFNSKLLQKYISVVFNDSLDIQYMFRASTRRIFSHDFVTESDVLIIIRGEEFEQDELTDSIENIIERQNKKNSHRFRKYIGILNKQNIKVDFVYQDRPITKISASKFMEKLDDYRYKSTLNIETKEDLFELMEFIPKEIKLKDKYKIIKRLLSFNTFV